MAMTGLNKQKGFTLIELLIVVSIMAVLMSMAVPAFTGLIRDNKVLTATNGLVAGLNLARNEAIVRGNYVLVCPTDDPSGITCNTNWANGWLIYTSAAVSGNPTATTIIKVGSAASGVDTSNSTVPSKIAFSSRGLIATTITAATNDTLIVDASSCTSGKDKRRTITITATGRAITTLGTCP